MDATSLTTGVWIDADTLDFSGPVTVGTVGQPDKELDPQIVQIDERLTRIETLLGHLQPATGKAQAVKLESDPTLEEE